MKDPVSRCLVNISVLGSAREGSGAKISVGQAPGKRAEQVPGTPGTWWKTEGKTEAQGPQPSLLPMVSSHRSHLGLAWAAVRVLGYLHRQGHMQPFVQSAHVGPAEKEMHSLPPASRRLGPSQKEWQAGRTAGRARSVPSALAPPTASPFSPPPPPYFHISLR